RIGRAGTLLRLVGQRGYWYEVVVPGLDGLKGQTGFISKWLIDDTTAPPSLPKRVGPRPTVARTQPVRSQRLGFAGFGQFGYTRFAAQNSFQAITGTGGGAMV